jgi:hypothetical protein
MILSFKSMVSLLFIMQFQLAVSGVIAASEHSEKNNHVRNRVNTNKESQDMDLFHNTILAVDSIDRKFKRAEARQQFDRYEQGGENYGNKADFDGLQAALNDPLLCKDNSTTILLGGLFEGDLAENLLNICNTFALYGLEIQADKYQIAKEKLSRFPYATIINAGWGRENAVMPYTGDGEMTGNA